MDPRLRRLLLFGLVALAVCVKAVLALSLADVFFYGEELEKGAAAKAMLDGLGVPHHQLAYHYYEGGGFVTSHLVALVFAVVGENLLAHKLVALGWFTAILVVGWTFLRRTFGVSASLWFAALLILSPASFQKLSSLSLGIHFEATLFLLLAFWLTLRIGFQKDLRLRTHALLGLVVGLGTYFSYQTALVGAWCLVWLLLRHPGRTLGLGGLAGLAGTALGLIPLVWMWTLVGEAVFDIHGTTRVERPPSSVQLRSFLLAIYGEESALGSRVGPFVWPLAALCAALATGFDRRDERQAERRRFLFVSGFALLWCTVYALSPFVQPRVPHFFYLLRLAPLWIVSLLVIAIALGQRFGLHARPGRGLALAGGGALLALGMWNTLQILGEGTPRELRSGWNELRAHKGYVYASYFDKFEKHLSGDDAQRLSVLLRFDEPDRESLVVAAVGAVFSDPGPNLAARFADAERVLAEVLPEQDREAGWIGLGRLLVVGSGWNAPLALTRLEGLPADRRRDLLAEGVGRFGNGGHPTEAALLALLDATHASPLAEPFARGLGSQLALRHRLHPARAETFLDGIGPHQAALRAGYERARAAQLLPRT